MIKLIASDLDGTLLQNGAQALTPRAIELISRSVRCRNPFCICQRKTVR